MDFAPYQSDPETQRALSPPPPERESRRSFSPQSPTKPSAAAPQPWPVSSSSSYQQQTPWRGDSEALFSEFETSLPIRLDYEAALAYVILPPVGAVGLLVFERASDYVRFHAWQSALLFSALFVLHLIVSWSAFVSWVLLVCDIALIGVLSWRAYFDASTLDRCEVPFFGRLASSILDDE